MSALLFDISFDPPRSRRTDPMTSKRTDTVSYRFSGAHNERIKAFLRAVDNGGTKDEIAHGTGLTDTQVARRMRELVVNRVVVNSGEVRLSSSGNDATVWRLV